MRVRTNEEIETKQDVLFLINSLINRQESYFNEQDILNLAIKYTANSAVSCSNEELKEMIRQNIDVSCRNGLMIATQHGYKNIY